MAEETQDVKPAPASEELKAPEASEGVKTPDVVDKTVYEKVREDMKAERQAKREAQARLKELEERLTTLEQSRTEDDFEEERRDPRLDVLYLVNKDSFVKENLDLIEQRMSQDKSLDVHQAVRALKAEMFDRIQKEVSGAEPSKQLKQEKVTATPEPEKPQLSGDLMKDALEGKLDNVPNEQLAAIKRVMGNLKK